MTNSNPIVAALLTELKLSPAQRSEIVQTMDFMVCERAQGSDVAVLTNPIKIGIGTK